MTDVDIAALRNALFSCRIGSQATGMLPLDDVRMIVRAAPALLGEVERLRAVIAQHDLCHNLHGKVDARAFADGCAAEQRNLYGYAPDADLLADYRAQAQAAEEILDSAGVARDEDDEPGGGIYALSERVELLAERLAALERVWEAAEDGIGRVHPDIAKHELARLRAALDAAK